MSKTVNIRPWNTALSRNAITHDNPEVGVKSTTCAGGKEAIPSWYSTGVGGPNLLLSAPSKAAKGLGHTFVAGVALIMIGRRNGAIRKAATPARLLRHAQWKVVSAWAS